MRIFVSCRDQTMSKLLPILIACWAFSIPECGAQNLVFNPSFEDNGGTPETADGWELFGAGGDVVRLTEMPNTGDAHIRLSGDPAEGANFAVLVQRELPVTPANDYDLDLFVRGDPVDGQVGYRVEFYNDGGGLIGGMFDNNVFIDSQITTDYQEFSSVFTAPASAATGVIVIFWEVLAGLTTIDVDDVSFALATTGGESADFDGDGLVDGDDFVLWQRNSGGAGGASMGDANGDGQVNAADLSIWEQQYGTSINGTLSSSAVPEPSSGVLAGLSLAGLLFRRRRMNR